MLPDMKTMRPTSKAALTAFAVLVGVCAWFGYRQCGVKATPPPAPPPALPLAVELPDAGAPISKVIPTTAQITFGTVPPVLATVSWGKKRLGRIEPHRPLVVVRPRDSGPLDVVIKAEGFLPVHTRAHTFSDNKVIVKLTPPEQTNTLLGYRVPIDAGVPAPLEGAPGLTTDVPPDPALAQPLPVAP